MRGVQPPFFLDAVNTKLATDMLLQGTAKHTCSDHCKRFVNSWQAMEQCSEAHSRSGLDFASNTAIHKGMILQLGACADAVHNMTWQAEQSAAVQNNLLLHRLSCCLRVQLVQHRNTSQVPLLATGQGSSSAALAPEGPGPCLKSLSWLYVDLLSILLAANSREPILLSYKL